MRPAQRRRLVESVRSYDMQSVQFILKRWQYQRAAVTPRRYPGFYRFGIVDFIGVSRSRPILLIRRSHGHNLQPWRRLFVICSKCNRFLQRAKPLVKPLPPAPPGFFANGTPFVEPQADRGGLSIAECAEKERKDRLGRPVKGCKVCHHKERTRIEALRVAGVSIDKLGEMFSIHRDAIWRHCTKHMRDEARATYLLGPAKIADLAVHAANESRSIVDYLAITRSILVNQMDREAQLNKPYAVERLAGRLVEVLRELGHATGEVHKLAGTVINIQNNHTQILNSQPFIELQRGLLQVCAAHPEARADIISLFRSLDDQHAASDAPKLIEHEAAE
jgi:hypothetical protein